MLTNNGLVAHVKKALSEKWGYVWGTFGQVLTESLLSQKAKQYPSGVGSYLSFINKTWLGRKTSDCVGLIKSYYWTKDGKVNYDNMTDVSADMMYNRAKEKGTISSLPDIPGICVWKKGHIGVYIGNGQVIEAHGTKYGVIQTPLKGSGATAWTNWLKCPFIDYVVEEASKPEPIIIQYGKVTASVLNVRNGAGTNFKIIGTLKKDSKVRIDKLMGDWYSIYYGDHGGFVHKNYIKPV